MAGWRDIKAQARDLIHRTFEVPAIYLTHLDGVPVAVQVRIHTNISIPGEDFTGMEMSPRFEFQPKIIFRTVEVPNPAPKGLVIVDATEIYRIGTSRPDREGYTEVDMVRVGRDELKVIVPRLQAKGVLQ